MEERLIGKPATFWGPDGSRANQVRAESEVGEKCDPYAASLFFSESTLSVLSHVKSGSSRPKCP